MLESLLLTGCMIKRDGQAGSTVATFAIYKMENLMNKVLFALLLIAQLETSAEDIRPDVRIKDVGTRELHTPFYQNDDGDDSVQISGMPLSQYGNKKWLQISVQYETRPEWIDRLTLEFYLLLPTPEKEKMLFKGIVSYVDIPESREHLAEMYIHFNSYERYYGRGKIQTAVLAKVDGKIVAIDQRNSLKDQWWEGVPSHPAGLLNRLDTPFGVINVEDYEAQAGDF